MILNPKTGLTVKMAYDFINNLIASNKDNIMELKECIDKDYEVPDEVLDSLEHKENLSPDDIRTLARATGLDYEMLTSKELPEDFGDRFNSAVEGLYALRNQFKTKTPQGE